MSRRAAVGVVVGLIVLTIIGVTAAVVAASAARAGFGNLVVVPVGAVTAFSLMFIVLGVYRLLGAGRDAAVARRFVTSPAIVFASGRTAGIKDALIPYRVDDRTHNIPYDFTVACNGVGIRLWVGPIAEPITFAEIPWAEIARMTAGSVGIDQRRSRGLVLQTSSGGRIELQPLGKGFLAMFPYSMSDLRDLVEDLRALSSKTESTAP